MTKEQHALLWDWVMEVEEDKAIPYRRQKFGNGVLSYYGFTLYHPNHTVFIQAKFVLMHDTRVKVKGYEWVLHVDGSAQETRLDGGASPTALVFELFYGKEEP